MGKVRVLIPSSLRQYWGGGARIEMDAMTLGDCIVALGPLASRILDDQGDIRRHVNLFVNQSSVRTLDMPLADGDIIHVLPAVSGGTTWI